MRNDTLLFGTALALLFAAAIVASQGTNEALFLWFNREAAILPDVFWANMTFAADTLFAVAVIAAVGGRHPHMFNSGIVLLITGALFVHGLKFWFEIPRPPAVLDPGTFHLIGPKLTNHAFASGHSFTALATAALLAVNIRSNAGAIALILVALIAALSRAAVAAHWPLDILVGSAAGLMIGVLTQRLTNNTWWLQGEGLQRFTAAIMTIACISLLFHDSRYPGTRPLAVAAGLIALLSLAGYWKTTLLRLRK